MKNQTLSVEQMIHLKELGINTSKASMVCIFTDDKGCVQDWYELIDLSPIFFVGMKMCYYDANSSDYDHSYREDCGVFTLQDIIELLPKQVVIVGVEDGELGERAYWIRIEPNVNGWQIYYTTTCDQCHCSEFVESESLLEAAYQMLCWCAENGYLKGGEK